MAPETRARGAGASIDTIKLSKKRPTAKTLRRIVGAMERDGVLAFENLFPLALLERIQAHVLRRHDSGILRRRGLIRDVAGRYAAILPFEGPLLEPSFYASPRLLEILEAFLGSDFCIGSLETVVALPGAVRQHQHIDGPLRFDRRIKGRKVAYSGDLSGLPPYALGLATPLCDVGEDNGPTAVWPGSHRTALWSRPPGEAKVLREFPERHMTGPFGRSYIFDYRLFHGGTPNWSREARPLLMLVFTRAWFRDPNLTEIEPSVVISKANLRRIPERFRRLFLLAPTSRRSVWTA